MPEKGGKRSGSRRAAQAVDVRVIAGAFRRRRIRVPAASGLRPTPDRVRETLFNWLHADTEGATCLDLFAGSGALALEAASRGAARVVAVESDARLADALRATAREFGADVLEVIHTDAWRWLNTGQETFDIVFLDPPFHESAVTRALDALAESPRLATDALVYFEQEASAPAPTLPVDWRMLRCDKAGAVRYHLALVARGGDHSPSTTRSG